MGGRFQEDIASATVMRSPILLIGFENQMGGDFGEQLRSEGFPLAVCTFDEALAFTSQSEPSLTLVYLSGVDASGVLLSKELQSRYRAPVILVSSSDDEADTVAGLEGGADDYFYRPDRPHELVARVRAVLRRSTLRLPADDRQVVQVGDISLDPARHELYVRGVKVELTLREFELLGVLVANPGRVWSRLALMLRVWGEIPPSGTKSLEMQIHRIRARIEADPSNPTRIVTVRGVGYKYTP